LLMSNGLVPERLPRVKWAWTGRMTANVPIRKMAVAKAPASLLP